MGGEMIADYEYAKEPVRNLLLSHSYSSPDEWKPNGRRTKPQLSVEHCPRFKRVLSIILNQNPDVITMQELDHFDDFMLPQLRSVGYEGIFQPKHKSVASNFNGGRRDGVAIFWNTHKIELDQRIPVGWNDTGSLHVSLDEMKNGNPQTNRGKQVAIAVRLQVKETKKHFL